MWSPAEDVVPETLMSVTGNSLVEHGHSATSEMPSHGHSASCSTAGAHHHGAPYAEHNSNTAPWGVYATGNYIGSSGSDSDNDLWNTSTDGNHSHTVTIGNTGGDAAHNIMQPYQVVYRWRRTA